MTHSKLCRIENVIWYAITKCSLSLDSQKLTVMLRSSNRKTGSIPNPNRAKQQRQILKEFEWCTFDTEGDESRHKVAMSVQDTLTSNCVMAKRLQRLQRQSFHRSLPKIMIKKIIVF